MGSNSDIVILGAGPAGLTAALVLGRSGIPCTLLDEGTFPREKICGDGLSGKVTSTLEKIDPVLVTWLRSADFSTGSRSVRFVAPSAKMTEIRFSGGSSGQAPGFVCKRIDFDDFLLREVLKNPSVRYIDRSRVSSILREGPGWILECPADGAVHRTSLLLFAAGARNRMLRSLMPGYPPVSAEGIGVRQYFRNVSGSDDNFAIEIHFLRELLPWYFWIFPFSDGSANVGLALPATQARQAPESLAKLLGTLIKKYPHLSKRFENAVPAGKPHAHRLPYYTGRMELGSDRLLLLGDAARLIDPFTGEGISHAMISGMIAADMIVKSAQNGGDRIVSSEEYTGNVYAALGEELDLGLKLHNLARNRRLLNLVIGKAARNERTRMLLEEMLVNMNTKGRLSKPLFYFKLAMGL